MNKMALLFVLFSLNIINAAPQISIDNQSSHLLYIKLAPVRLGGADGNDYRQVPQNNWFDIFQPFTVLWISEGEKKTLSLGITSMKDPRGTGYIFRDTTHANTLVFGWLDNKLNEHIHKYPKPLSNVKKLELVVMDNVVKDTIKDSNEITVVTKKLVYKQNIQRRHHGTA